MLYPLCIFEYIWRFYETKTKGYLGSAMGNDSRGGRYCRCRGYCTVRFLWRQWKSFRDFPLRCVRNYSPGRFQYRAPAATTTNTALSASSTSVVTIRTTAPVSVPQEGAFVKVSYLGGYSGTYGVNGAVEKVRGSGEQVYAVSATSGTLQATFQKQDGSPRHDLIVEIWKGGKAITSQKNSSAYGIVSVSSSV